MPDLHITSTLLGGPASAVIPDSGTSGSGAFSSLLAGTIAAAPTGSPVATDAAEPALSATHALDSRRQSALEPVPDPTRDSTLEPGLDVARMHADSATMDSDPQPIPDSATQFLMALGILPPPVAPREGAAAGPRQGVTTTVDVPGTPASTAVGAPASALAPVPAASAAGERHFDPAEVTDTAHEQPRLDTFVPAAVAAGGMQKGARTIAAAETVTGNGAQGIQAPNPAAVSLQQPVDSGAAPSGPTVPVQLNLSQALGSPAWREAFASSVSLLATQRVASADINLHPAELGPVQISIRIEGGEASIVFAAQHADTRSALDAALPRLREMLEANGIALGQASVGAQSSGSDPAGRHPESGSPAGTGTETATDASSSPASIRAIRSDQLVDIFA